IFPDVYFIARFGLMQFNQFPIGKMDMSKSANSAPKNPDVVDCSHLAALGIAAVLQQFYKVRLAVNRVSVARKRENTRSK
ncbi:hypothetical protein, partial [Bradyrhizobium sp.]|uniref:hypothetical protein n=1 Tax=Bradyrhizobium sp. TaxID=376 RepID=UPI003C740BC0